MSKLQKYASELLKFMMREHSEEIYAAGWLCDLEYRIWSIVNGDGVDPTQIYWPRFLEVANDANGWWAWSEEQGHEVFVPMPEWIMQYQQWKESTNA